MPDRLDDGSASWRELRDDAQARFRGAGIPDPELEVRLIVERATGADRVEMVLLLEEPARERSVAHFDAMVARRLAGEPLQYVLGAWGFRELDLLVDGRALIPRPETEVVVQEALTELDRRASRSPRLRALDLGTGSGAIALSLVVERDDVDVWAVDVSSDAVALARANLAGVGRRGSRVRLFEGSWFDALPADAARSFDLLVSNPPYVADHEDLPAVVADWEPEPALRAGPLGTEAQVLLLREGIDWLASGASIVLELAPHQATALESRAVDVGYEDVRITSDLAGRPRVLVARAPERSVRSPR
jgi:release factor glutamine methyltransferase